jgi:hypothetical protein
MTTPEKCSACDGSGLTGLFGNEKKPVPRNGQVKVFHYWPERLVTTVRPDTLKLWRRDLEAKAEATRQELAKFEGGILHIDQEYERRAAEKKGRRPITNHESPAVPS